MRIVRQILCIFALTLGGFLSAAASAAEIVDVAGRKVSIDGPAQRVVLSSVAYIEAVSIIQPSDPIGHIVGIAKGPVGLDPSIERQLIEKWPAYNDIAIFGGRGAESVSVERILTLKPEVAVFGVSDHGPGANASELIQQLEKAGVAVVFIDFRMDPLKNTTKSIQILGKVFGAEEKAQAFVDYHNNGLRLVRERVSTFKGDRPKVFLQAHVGRMACCVAMAHGMLGPIVGLVGGENISAAISPGPVGRHSMEFLISSQIDVLIGTASGRSIDFDAGKPMIVLGGDVSKEIAAASLERAVASPSFEAIPAWRTKRIHGIWHNFYNSPFNLYAVMKFAKWIQPDLFEDVDAEQTLKDMYDRFTPFELSGTHAVSLGR